MKVAYIGVMNEQFNFKFIVCIVNGIMISRCPTMDLNGVQIVH